MMNKENMLKWAEALESGNYRQCHGAWGDGEATTVNSYFRGYCCLHVAYREFTGSDIDWESDATIDDPFHVQNTLRGYLYPELATAAYTQMNDIDRLSFREIAQVIKEKVKNAKD